MNEILTPTNCFQLIYEVLKTKTDNFERKDIFCAIDGMRAIYQHSDGRRYEVYVRPIKEGVE